MQGKYLCVLKAYSEILYFVQQMSDLSDFW